MKTFFTLILIILVCKIISAQITFEKDYDLLKGYYVQQLHDESYLVCTNEKTSAQIVKMNRFGDLLWKKDISVVSQVCPNAIESADHNIMYVSTEGKEICITKLDNEGEVILRKSYNPGMGDYGLRIQQTEDGGMLIAGMGITESRYHVILMKTDTEGNKLWEKNYIFHRNDLVLPFPGMRLVQSADNIYILAHNYIYTLSNSGELLNTITLTSDASSLIKIADGFIVSGLKYLSRIRNTGEVVWTINSKKLLGQEQLFVCRTQDDNILVTGLFGYSKISFDGDTLWSVNNYHRSHYISSAADGGFIITGGNDKAPYLWLQKIRDDGFFAALNIITPVKNNILESRSEYEIKWSKKNVNGVNVHYSSNDGISWFPVAENIQETSIEWTVPFAASTTSRLKISDIANTALPSISDRFTVSMLHQYDTISINNFTMWIGNNGETSFDPVSDGSGGLWQNIPAIFTDGLIWGGMKNGKLHVCGSTYRTGLKPGRPDNSLYGIYKIRRDMNPATDEEKFILNYSYDNWPGEYGAPFTDVDNDNQFTRGVDVPRVLGDETLWFVANDFDTAASRWIYGTDPIGVELQSTTYGYKNIELSDIIFKKYKLINKSGAEISDMYFGYWSDPDLGYANDDRVGCDTLLDLGYFYNGDNEDEYNFGSNPPALGYCLLQGPVISAEPEDSALYNNDWITGKRNLQMTAFHPLFKDLIFMDATLGSSEGADMTYNQLQGRLWDGRDIIDPFTNKSTRFGVPGDPVAGIGWYDGTGIYSYSSGDRRLVMGMGPFNMAPNDTQEVVFALIAARGNSNLNSVTELKSKTRFVQNFYNNLIFTNAANLKSEPQQYYISQNYPNPFNPSTTIIYSVPEKTNVELIIYNILGKRVAILLNEEKAPGEYRLHFKAADLASGVYYYQLRTKNYVSTKKMILIR